MLKGQHCSKEHRKNISKSLMGNTRRLGKYHSEATRKKMSDSQKGKQASEETKKKLSKAKMGNKNWFGKCFSVEHRKNISKALKGKHRSKEQRRKLSEIHRGIPISKEQKEKMLKGRQRFFLSKQPTSIEKKVYEELKDRGLLFETQKLINGKFIVDAYIPSLNLIIEADGDYWHSLPKIVKKDKAENAYLTKCGFDLLRLSEMEINNNNFKEKLPN